MTARAVSARRSWAQMPAHVHAFVEETAGSPVVSYADQVGGMSPGCATRLVFADGTRLFVKAVGAELNPDTLHLFRREAMVLGLLGSHALWADLVASRDEHDWVTLVLEDVDGTHPDLGDDAQMDRLCAATDELSATLAERIPEPPPVGDFYGVGLTDLVGGFRKWANGLRSTPSFEGESAATFAERVPGWLLADVEGWADRVERLADNPGRQVQHWDIRHDNLLVRPSGELVFLDWGGTGVGPGWLDPLLARLERVDSPWFDRAVGASPALAAAGDDTVTSWLVGFGAWTAVRSVTAVDVNIPGLQPFRVAMAHRLLGAAARRLGHPVPGAPR